MFYDIQATAEFGYNLLQFPAIEFAGTFGGVELWEGDLVETKKGVFVVTSVERAFWAEYLPGEKGGPGREILRRVEAPIRLLGNVYETLEIFGGFPARLGITSPTFYILSGVWRSPVARLIRVQEVVGPNPATPTV